MKALFVGILSAGLLAAGGCDTLCSSGPISPPPLMRFPFSTDSLHAGFRQVEMRATYLVRYADNYFQQPLDTVRALQGSGYLQYKGQALTCYLSPPTDSKLPQSYRLNMPGGGRQFNLNSLRPVYDPANKCSSVVKQISGVLNGQQIAILPSYTLTR